MKPSTRPKSFCRDCWALWEAQQIGIWGLDEGPVQPPPKRAWRPTTPPGPRCATHQRERKTKQKAASHERRSKSVYGLEDYWGLYEFQGGHCALCLRATGATRRLSVDHDHATGTVRGLLCRPCNTLLGHARDSADFFIRTIGYLNNPPAIRFLKLRSNEEESHDDDRP